MKDKFIKEIKEVKFIKLVVFYDEIELNKEIGFFLLFRGIDVE